MKLTLGEMSFHLQDEDDGVIDLPLDFEALDLEGENPPEVESVFDGLVLSLNTYCGVRLDYIAKLTRKSEEEVIKELRGKIFEDPISHEWQTSDVYLSGNILTKLTLAKEHNENGRYEENIRALSKILPPDIATDNIFITLGSPWVPPDIIDAFIAHLIGEKAPWGYETRYNESTGIWEIPKKNRFRGSKHAVKNRNTYGTVRYEMLYLLEDTLNIKTIAIYDEVPDRWSLNSRKTVRVLNNMETAMALQKQAELVSLFQAWVWSSTQRKKRLRTIYEERYGRIRVHHYDGSFLMFPKMNPSIRLYPYQRDAVARILFSPNTLLAHNVGAGKTYTMIAAGMELRRMGVGKKNLYVVPNTLVGQWRDKFMCLYPYARILVVEPKNFTPALRSKTLARIRDEDFDGIIMPYSCFDAIPLSLSHYEAMYKEEMEKLNEAEKTYSSPGIIRRKKAALEKALKKNTEQLKGGIAFDELGVNTLFVDEAHNYKNMPVETKIDMIYGMRKDGSKKSYDMLGKVRAVQNANGGRGVVFATGTPITNSITDLFVMQKYLQNGEMGLLGLGQFDSWVGMFCEKELDFEVDVDTSKFRLATRFSKFHNLTELTALLSSIADFHRCNSEENGLPAFKGYTDETILGTLPFRDYLKDISKRADDIRAKRVLRSEDNMLKISSDGRKAALDLRLIDEGAGNAFSAKIEKCAQNVLMIYHMTSDTHATQLVFCDVSTPKKSFNAYDEMKRLLVLGGVPEGEIAYIHEVGESNAKRDVLFERVREGEVRILLGSTFKLGLGVNVQDRLIAVHHLDVPWRPSDMVQREGRILRQGNLNRQVFIYRYITEASFDAYSWQILETKQRFIEELLAGSLSEREGEDVDSTALNYADVKALAIGNPLIKKRVEVANELARVCLLRKGCMDERRRMQQELADTPALIEEAKTRVAACEEDIARYEEEKKEFSPEEWAMLQEQLDKAVRDNRGTTEEIEVMTYQGFRILIPSFMSMYHYSFDIIGKGKYRLPCNSDEGHLKKVDAFLDNLKDYRQNLLEQIKKWQAQKRALEKELKKTDNYGEEIERLQQNLEKIDKELGIIEDE